MSPVTLETRSPTKRCCFCSASLGPGTNASTRRIFLPLAVIATIGWHEPLFALDGLSPSQASMDINQVALRIRAECAPMLRYAKESQRFFYRGVIEAEKLKKVAVSSPDLLSPGTYSASGTAFFMQVEGWLKNVGSQARPSTGHIAVSNETEAGIWGIPCSCWPTGDFHYCWFENSRLFYHDGPLDTSSDPQACLSALGLRTDRGITEALLKEHEVLFDSPKFYLVPSAQDAELKLLLGL